MRCYVYLNIDDPLVAWETAIGRLCSADVLEQDKIFSLSLRQYSLFRKFATQTAASPQIANELRLDSVRISLFKDLPSRLRGIFLFRNLEDARAASKRWRLRHFIEENLSEVEISPSKMAFLDSEWSTHNLAGVRDDSWMHHYWSGETFGEAPLIEVVCSGVGYILNQALRKRAYETIMQKLPKAVPILSIATVGFFYGFQHVAQIVPYLRTDDKSAKGLHYINMQDLHNDGDLLIKLKEHKEPFPPLVEPLTKASEIQLPDFTDSWFTIDHSSLMLFLGSTFDQSIPISSIPFDQVVFQSHNSK